VSLRRAVGTVGVRVFFFGVFQGGRFLSKETVLRANYIIIAFLILLGLAVKTMSFADLAAEAATRSETKVSVEASEMHRSMKFSGGQS
jgi:hypothetical protein